MNHLASLAQAGLAASGRLMIPVDLANGCLRSVVFGARSANLASLALSGHCREGCDKLQRVAAGSAKRPFTIHHLLWQASHKNPVNPSFFFVQRAIGWPQRRFAQAGGLFFGDGRILEPALAASLPMTRRLPCWRGWCLLGQHQHQHWQWHWQWQWHQHWQLEDRRLYSLCDTQ